MRNPAPARLRRLVRRFSGRRVAVVGDLMLDRFVRGSVRRISPEGPVPVVEVSEPETVHLGGAGNVAANLTALGARTAVFGVVGRDAAGQLLRRELGRLRASPSGLLVLRNRPTTVKVRIIADHQHVVRADWEAAGPLDARSERRLLGEFSRLARSGDLEGVVLSDYDKGVLSDTLLEGLLESARAHSVPVFVDLKRAWVLGPQSLIRLLLVNQRRAEEISGLAVRDPKSLELVGRHLVARFPCQTLIITQGSQGMVVFEGKRSAGGGRRGNPDPYHYQPVRTRPWEVFDVTGAGDTAMATLTMALLAGATGVEAAGLANLAAGVVVGKLGTAVCSSRELVACLGGR